MKIFDFIPGKFRPWWFVIIAVIFNIVCLFPEIKYITPDLNDNVYHYGLLLRMNEALARREFFWDTWIPYWCMGYPIFHYYQPLPYLIVIILHKLTFNIFSLFTVFKFLQFFLITTFPVTVYLGIRKFGFSSLQSGFSSLAVSLLSTSCLYGWEWESYIWRGYGMYSQLIAMYLFPVTMGEVYQSVTTGKKYWRAVFFISVNFLLHFFFGYMCGIFSFYLIFSEPHKKKILFKLKNIFIIGFFSFLVLMHIIIPFYMNKPYHGHSMYDPLWKWDSYGIEWVLENFFNGKLLDYSRFPVMTIFGTAGFLICLSRNKDHYRLTWLLFSLSIIFLAGKPFLGELTKFLLPFGERLHLHRLINMIDFSSIMCIGVSMSYLWDRLDYKKNSGRFYLSFLLTFIILFPLYKNRIDYGKGNLHLIKRGFTSYSIYENDFSNVMKNIKEPLNKRVYAGRRGNWGKGFTVGRIPCYMILAINGISCLSNIPFGWSFNGDFQCFFDEKRESHYRLFNIGYVVSEPYRFFPSFANRKYQTLRYSLREIEGTGYFDFLDIPILAKGDNDHFWSLTVLWLKSIFPDVKQHFAIDFSDKLNPSDFKRTIYMKDKVTFLEDGKEKNIFQDKIFAHSYPGLSNPGVITCQTSDGFYYKANIQAKRDCYVIFKMTYHPNWNVSVDGKRVETIHVSPSFMAMKISKGYHSVMCHYDSGRLKVILLIIGLISFLILFIVKSVK